jgi:hypothetical protein
LTHSESIKEIASALAKAQGQMELAKKSEANPYFKSKYADLAEIWDVIRKPLSDNGLSVAQGASSEGSKVKCSTLLMHTSGEWLEDVLEMTAKDASPQAIGSGITYARRYGIQAMVGVAAEKDDDGNMAQPPEPKPEPKLDANGKPIREYKYPNAKQITPDSVKKYSDATNSAIAKTPEIF